MLTTNFLTSPTSLHADTVEIGAAVRGGVVGVTGRAAVADDVALQGRKRGLRGKIDGPLKIIRSICHALPAYGETRWIIGRG